VLDDLDKELTRRGLRFCRYAMTATSTFAAAAPNNTVRHSVRGGARHVRRALNIAPCHRKRALVERVLDRESVRTHCNDQMPNSYASLMRSMPAC
jgi:hypothetical protein